MSEDATKVIVRLIKHTGPYNPGELAGFAPDQARSLIQSGAAIGGTYDEATGEFKVETVAPAAARSEINDTVVKTAVPTGGGETTNIDIDVGVVKTNASSPRGAIVAKAVSERTGEALLPEATSAAEPVNLGQGQENELADEFGDGEGDATGNPVEKVDADSVDIPDGWEHLSPAERKHIASLLSGEEVTTVADAAPIIRAEVARREKQA